MPTRVLLLLMLLFLLLPVSASADSANFIFLPLVMRQLPTPSEQEPNNTRAQANGPLQSGIIYYGVHDPDQDTYDIFFFEATRSGPVRVILNNHPASSLQLQLHSATTVLPLRYDYLAPYQIDYPQVQAGRYYIAIYTPPSPASGQVYQLSVTYP